MWYSNLEKRTALLPEEDSGSPPASVTSGVVEFGPADASREATPNSTSEDRATSKRRSTEKLLGQVFIPRKSCTFKTSITPLVPDSGTAGQRWCTGVLS